MVKVIETFEHLLRQILLVRESERESRMIDQTGQIVREIFKDHETFVLFNHYLQEADDIMISEMLKQLDLSNCRHREAILLALHSDLLERNFTLGIDMDPLEHFSVRSSADNRLIARLSVIHRFGISKLLGKCGAWLGPNKNPLLLGWW
jgi:hypothetical protein